MAKSIKAQKDIVEPWSRRQLQPRKGKKESTSASKKSKQLSSEGLAEPDSVVSLLPGSQAQSVDGNEPLPIALSNSINNLELRLGDWTLWLRLSEDKRL